jgi:hypothetical protein
MNFAAKNAVVVESVRQKASERQGEKNGSAPKKDDQSAICVLWLLFAVGECPG